MTRPALHAVALLVVELTTDLCRHSGWVPTRELAERQGSDRAVIRRVLRALSRREWVTRRDRDDAELWRRGPAIEDVGRAYMDSVRREYDLAQSWMGILALPLGPAWTPTPPQRVQLPELRERPVGEDGHVGTSTVCAIVELLSEVGLGHGVTGATVAGLLGTHRVTATTILDELVVHGWVARTEGDGPHQYRIGPGLPRLVHQAHTAPLSSPVVGAAAAGAARP